MKPPVKPLLPWQQRLLMLNRRQTRALFFGAGIAVLMGLFPPWERLFVNHLNAWFDRPAGYHWIFSPPDMVNTPNYMGSTIDWTLLFVQWIIAGATTMIFVWGFRDRLQDSIHASRHGPGRHTHF